MMLILTSWMILMVFFVAICVASGMRERSECRALVNQNSPEPEFTEVVPSPERSIGDLSYTLKSA